MKRKMIEINCFKCGKAFLRAESEIKRNISLKRNNFCSLSCCSNHNHPKKIKENNLICDYCDKSFYKIKSRVLLSKSGFHFCSRICKDRGQQIGSGLISLQVCHYKNGSSNYRAIAFRELPNKCNRCGYNKYISVLAVHHKDRNRGNNSIENLEVLCSNCHLEEHLLNKDGQFWKSNGRDAKVCTSHLQ